MSEPSVKKRKVLSAFIASPGDLTDERKKFREVIEEVNRIKAASVGIHLEPLGWEDTLPGKGRPQGLINEDIKGCDLFVLLLWKRWGTPSGSYSSGTEEEFELARKLSESPGGRPVMWLYFKSPPEEMLADPGDHLQQVLKFRRKIEAERSFFYRTFETTEAWEREFRQHLCLWLDKSQPFARLPDRIEFPLEVEERIRSLEADARKTAQENATAQAKLTETALIFSRQAFEAARAGRLTEADSLFASSLATFEHPDVLNTYGLFLEKVGKEDQAEEKFKRLRELAIAEGNESYEIIASQNLGNIYSKTRKGQRENERRVVITGLGLISPIGTDKESFWQSLIEGHSGIRRVTRFDPAGYDCQIAGEIKDQRYKDLIEPQRCWRLPDVSQMAVAAAQMALADAGLSAPWPNPNAVGVIVGTAFGPIRENLEQQSILLERGANQIDSFLATSLPTSSIADEIAVTAHTSGLSFTMSGNTASSLCAIGTAVDMIRNRALDVCLVGGAESPIVPLAWASLSNTKKLAIWNDDPQRACRPFDQAHSGLVVSEGSCILVLEERTQAKQRGATIYGEVLGYALGREARDFFLVRSSGQSAKETLQELLNKARVASTEIEWVNADGSSIPQGDRWETRVLKEALGAVAYSIPISATKSVMGHTFGAAAAFQIASAVLAMQRGYVPPTINLDTPEAVCDLDYVPHHARPLTTNICLINSFAYGGIYSFLLLWKG